MSSPKRILGSKLANNPSSICRWDDVFYYAGIFIALSGLCSYMIEFCEKKAPRESDSDVSETKKAQLLH